MNDYLRGAWPSNRALSQEEYFDIWCHDLLDKGLLLKVEAPTQAIELIPEQSRSVTEKRVVYKGTKREQTRTYTKKVVLFQNMTYLPDRILYWSSLAEGKFFWDFDQYQKGMKAPFGAKWNEKKKAWVSVVDVKSPIPGVNRSDVSFDIKKKLLWYVHSIYVNKVIQYPVTKSQKAKAKKTPANWLWMATFIPSRYRLTDIKMTPRVLNFPHNKTLDEYLNM